MDSSVGIGLLGCGTVGGGVAERLIASPYRLRGIAVRTLGKPRPAAIPWHLYTRDANAVIDDPENDLIVECIGGTAEASAFLERALRRGKHVVTANKDLIATQGPRLHELARRSGATLQYEASVGGGIPIVRTISQSLSNEEIFEVGGVLNGTTNFILTRMHEGAPFCDALLQAQQCGFAEADSTSDLSGADAAHKLAILSQLAFRIGVSSDDIPRRGLETVDRADVQFAQSLGYIVKLVAFAWNAPEEYRAAVTPALVARSHAFAAPQGVENCIRIRAKSSGTLTFSGTGAGREPTASAVLSDIAAALRSIANGGPLPLAGVALRETRTVTPGLATLGRIVRFDSYRDARPAQAVLETRGYRTRLIKLRAALEIFPQSGLDDAEILQALELADIAPAGILPVWRDTPHPLAPATTPGREKDIIS